MSWFYKTAIISQQLRLQGVAFVEGQSFLNVTFKEVGQDIGIE